MQHLHLHKSVIGQAVPQEAPQRCCAEVLFCWGFFWFATSAVEHRILFGLLLWTHPPWGRRHPLASRWIVEAITWPGFCYMLWHCRGDVRSLKKIVSYHFYIQKPWFTTRWFGLKSLLWWGPIGEITPQCPLLMHSDHCRVFFPLWNLLYLALWIQRL